MLELLFQYLKGLDFPGAGLFDFLSFRATMALVTSLIVSIIFGRKIIYKLRSLQIGETVRDLGLDGQMEKSGTPTMGGVIILLAILIPTLLFADLSNIYIITMLLATTWLGAIGFLDDYIKVFKKNKEGLAGRFKVVGQVGVGLIVGLILYFHPDVVVREYVDDTNRTEFAQEDIVHGENGDYVEYRSLETNIPFVKDNTFDYLWLVGGNKDLGWLIYVPIVIFIVIAVSNGANMTDGLDGLAAGSSAIIGLALAILAYVTGNAILSGYLNVMYIPESSELVVFIAAFVGACVGFLWYNSFPASVFMGDTGSLALGGIIAVFAISIRKELLIPILCGIFFIENLSVIMQVGYFKYTKRKLGEGKRIFLMAPLHHHYQKKGWVENKIVVRFWLIGILLAAITLVTLKVR